MFFKTKKNRKFFSFFSLYIYIFIYYIDNETTKTTNFFQYSISIFKIKQKRI